MSYIGHIYDETTKNDNFRKVLFTGQKSQLVVMNIPAGGEIGMETHPNVEQTIFILEGSGVAILDGQETPVKDGDVIVVTPGTNHNVVNRSNASLKVYTIYAPANHIDGVVHKTKADADADTADEAFGEAVK